MLFKYIIIPVILISVSCGDNKSIGSKTGEVVGKEIMDFGKEVGKKVDEGVIVTIDLDKEVSDLGISKTISKLNIFDIKGDALKTKAVTVYIKYINPISATKLKLLALNDQNLEIGKSKIEISLDKDDAKFVDFPFDSRTDFGLVKKYLLQLSK